MSIQRTSASPAPSTHQWKYDVFLSFRGADTRRGFTRNLYTALEHKGIRTFMDDPELRKGEEIAPALLTAIEESRIAIIVLSKNYASSWWCLDELVRILECMKASETVLPVFYDVNPCEVRRQTGSFGEAFIKLEERFSDDKEKLLTWRTALAEVANLSGWTSNDERYETGLIRKIVGDIWKKLPPTSFGYAENLVGMDRILEPLHSLLGVGEDDVRFIGIWGMGGIGKTTMVRAVKDKISPQFECTFLLSNVRDSIEKDGLLSLQKQLLKAMIPADEIDQILDHHEAATRLRWWLSRKKVLLILDDVKDHKHLELLAGNQKWFGFGSRVLITTRDEHLLIKHGVERRLKVETLDDYHSLQLFSRKAFKRSYPETDFLDLSRSVINYAKGLPLALEVLGSSLFGRDQRAWESALSQLGRVRNLEILDVLKISYKDLDSDGKKIFLDIACFFNGEDKGRITDVLTSCGFSAEFQIDVLMQRSLLTERCERLWMHDLLQELGHEIVHQESPNELGRRSRLWPFEDVKYVLTKNTATEAVEGIFVDSIESGAEMDVTPKSFSMMHKLRYLKIKNANVPKELEYLPDSLRILDWKGYPSKSLPSNFNPHKLHELNLCHSCIKNVRIGTEPLRNLKTLNLSHSLNLVKSPNFKDMPNLELLILEGCIRLYEVDPGIAVLERLIVLNMKDCKSLVYFPSSVGGLKSVKDLNLSGCSKLDKLPDDLGNAVCLEKLDLSGSGIREVPFSIGHLENLKELSFAGCKARSSKSWNMLFNPFRLLRKTSHIPIGLSLSCLSSMHSLTDLDLSDCNLSEDALPSDFGCLASLESLDLTYNQFVRLPESIGKLPRLGQLDLDGCHKLQILPQLGSDVWVNAGNCFSLDALANQLGQCNSVVQGYFVNCFKMVENESNKSIVVQLLRLLARHLEGKAAFSDDRVFEFVCPGNEIPEWYNHQSVESSIIVELHPGWFCKKFMGFAYCVVFVILRALPNPDPVWWIDCYLTANGSSSSYGTPFGVLLGTQRQPVFDHIWFRYVRHDDYSLEWQDIYYKLKFSFRVYPEEMIQMKKCGVRLIYEDDVKELQTLLKQSSTKRSLQHYDDDDDGASISSATQAHPKRIKQLHLADT